MYNTVRSISLGMLAALVLLAASSSSLRAQKYGNSIALGAVFAGVPTIIQGQFEKRIGDDQSLVARAMYGLKTSDGYTGFGLGAVYRFFINNDQPVKGLSVGPAVEILFYSNSSTSRSSRIFLLGGEAGYKLLIGDFSIEPVISVRIGVSGGESVSKFTSTLVYPGVYLGYAW